MFAPTVIVLPHALIPHRLTNHNPIKTKYYIWICNLQYLYSHPLSTTTAHNIFSFVSRIASAFYTIDPKIGFLWKDIAHTTCGIYEEVAKRCKPTSAEHVNCEQRWAGKEPAFDWDCIGWCEEVFCGKKALCVAITRKREAVKVYLSI